jgi:hypothetical protein
MPANPNIKLTLNFNDPDLDPEERDEQARRLIVELRQMDEVDRADRVPDPHPPAGNKSGVSFLTGMVTTEVQPTNFQPLLGLIGDRCSYLQ